MHRYRLRFTADTDTQTHFDSPSPVEVGDVIPAESGFHHLVFGIEEASSPEPLLLLAKSGQGHQDAIDQAWPEQRQAALGTPTPAGWLSTGESPPAT